LRDHVIICGYGRVGQNVAHFLEEEQIPYAALDLDPARVKEAHLAGERVYYGDAAERDILEALGIDRARLVVVSHADTAAALLAQAGYGDEVIERVKKAVGKRALKKNPDTQLLEDVTALVFIEHYMLDFAAKHPEYDAEKWCGIIRKTWEKMSMRARDFAQSGGIRLPEPLIPLIQKSIAAD
jgi:Trk K+ transport system NAD-binding subunit